MDKVANVLIGTNLFSIVRYWAVFWLILIDPFLPDLFTSVDLVWQFFEEEGVLIGKLVLREPSS